MYDHLSGEVIEKRAALVVLRVSGVGYEVKVPLATAARLEIGRQEILYTILHVVEGVPTLLGFLTKSERDLARRILAVTGVGPTIVLSVLSVFTPDEFVGHVADNDPAALCKVRGVGRKTAERLCLELRDVAAKLGKGSSAGAALAPRSASDASAALVTLGFSEREARAKVEKARGKLPDADTEQLVKAVLGS
ncbi:MAG: Holliday junction branch migration protein RuvA [Planctomycetota bacterium]